MSLNGQFLAGQELYEKIENTSLASSDPVYQEDVKNAILLFSKCAELVSKLNLFSPNETVDDINSVDLRFLLVEAYLGDLTSKLVNDNRVQTLNTAKRYFEQFLRNGDLYEILKEDASILDFTLSETPSGVTDERFMKQEISEKSKDAAKRREEKIARFKREKETKARLEKLQKQLSSVGDEDKEDVNREHVLTLIDLFIQKSIEQLISINQEINLLNQMNELGDRARRDASSKKANDDRVEHTIKDDSSPLLSSDGRILRPFVITNKREEIRQQVFRPGWRLPTMTIDEYLQQEAERGNIIVGGGQMPEKKVIDDNDESAIDAETYKAREWDDFKDDNPRGWGNKIGKG
ncbi:5287_t:CDS:2 [Acaulospora morrowiae]|uniref:5287_t:CDS:1 n=1 Tax=Acaulospora morrowiae TaxID=94023 RepID=A0A9N8ZMJ5_9GLOM|nr:5287_t:CDS:2 [Acaulospora morrowiae]